MSEKMKRNLYWHELTDEHIKGLITQKKTIGYVLKNYKQPDWCTYPEALSRDMGCWSLVDDFDLRKKISIEYCKKCDLFKKESK